jgi:hypothetical protein
MRLTAANAKALWESAAWLQRAASGANLRSLSPPVRHLLPSSQLAIPISPSYSFGAVPMPRDRHRGDLAEREDPRRDRRRWSEAAILSVEPVHAVDQSSFA